MKIKNLDELNKRDWNKFVLENQGSFLQSWEWGEFQENFGRQVFRLADFKAGWFAQFIEFKLPLGKKYWYGPRAPLLETQNSRLPSASPQANGEQAKLKAQNLEEFIRKVSKEAKKEKAMFFRIGPEWELDSNLNKELILAGFKRLPYDIEPSQTLILDISKSEEELLAQMHEKWRYNIHLAERKGVKVKIITGEDADFEKYFEEFYKLIDEGTSARKEIKHHPKEYYRKQLTVNSRQFQVALFVAEFYGGVIAANILVIFGQCATYLHGATSSEHREVMAPHLLQRGQIKEAKRQGCTEYDFWGIANEYTIDKRKKSWEGFTRFKKGFGGREVNYIGYWDYPLDKKWYFLYRLVQKFRR